MYYQMYFLRKNVLIKISRCTTCWHSRQNWSSGLSGLLYSFNRLRPRQNSRHFAEGIVKCIILGKMCWSKFHSTPHVDTHVRTGHRVCQDVSAHLTDWGQDKIAAILQTVLSNVLSSAKMIKTSVRCLPRGLTDDKLALVRVMIWHRNVVE